jgi:hypothetical protein
MNFKGGASFWNNVLIQQIIIDLGAIVDSPLGLSSGIGVQRPIDFFDFVLKCKSKAHHFVPTKKGV